MAAVPEEAASRTARNRTAIRFFMGSPFLSGVNRVVPSILHNSTLPDKPKRKFNSFVKFTVDKGGGLCYSLVDKQSCQIDKSTCHYDKERCQEEYKRVWNELGISGGTALIVLCALYFTVKWAVRKGIMEAHARITEGKKGWPRELWDAIGSEETASQ